MHGLEVSGVTNDGGTSPVTNEVLMCNIDVQFQDGRGESETVLAKGREGIVSQH